MDRNDGADLMNERNILSKCNILHTKPIYEASVVLGSMHADTEGLANKLVHGPCLVELRAGGSRTTSTRKVITSELVKQVDSPGGNL